MALPLYIPPCIHNPRHHFHPPDPKQPLRIRIQGPLETVRKLVPDASWYPIRPFPQPGGIELAKVTHKALYGHDGTNEAGEAIPVRWEYLAWAMDGRRPLSYIDYYGVTFDHNVPSDDRDPEVLMINLFELDPNPGLYGDGANYVKQCLPFPVDPADYTGKKVLAVPRCCQNKVGSTDRRLTNGLVQEQDTGEPFVF